jgi:hypothetical protein
VQVFQLAPGSILNVRRQLAGAFAPKDALRFAARKDGYHWRMLPQRGNMSRRGNEAIFSTLLVAFPAVGFNADISGEAGVHFAFGETDGFRREFNEGQAALLHHVVDGSESSAFVPLRHDK